MTPLNSHQSRVRTELSAAGMTKYGQLKFASRYLHNFIAETEHIMGVVYGRYQGGEALLAATDHRIMFLDKKPLFVSSDEIAYDAVTGITHTAAGLFAGITLHTKLGNYQLRYANRAVATHFVHYIEERLEARSQRPGAAIAAPAQLDDTATAFLASHDVAVLSTVDRQGNAAAAAVYYVADAENNLHLLTRSETAKAHNMLTHPQVALTIFEEDTVRTLQLQGRAEIEVDQSTKDAMFKRLTQRRSYWYREAPPPVMQLTQGTFVVFNIRITAATYRAFRGAPN